jgi:tetratricopeptide (TPR) repeat protein
MSESIFIFFTTPLGAWIAAIFTITPVLITVVLNTRRRLRLKNIEIEQLHALSETRLERINALKQELKKSEETIHSLAQQLPDSWLQDVANERKANNEERAIRCLRNGFESIREPFGIVCFELASHHFNLSVDYGQQHFHEAKRLAQIAALLCPANTEAKSFLLELLATEADKNFAFDNQAVFEQNWEMIEDFLAIKNHPEIIQTLANRADYYVDKGYYQLAERLYNRILAMLKRHSDSDSPVILRTSAVCAHLAGYTGHYRKALELLQDLLPYLERIFGKDHPDTLATRGNIAMWTGKLGDTAKALEFSIALLSDQERIMGKDYPDTLRTRGNIAGCIGDLGDTAKALELFLALLPDRERILGKDHPDTLITRNNIGYLTEQT